MIFTLISSQREFKVPSEKILGEIRWNQAFHALNANSGPAKFLALNNFGVSTPDSELSFVFVAFPLLVKI